MHKKSSSMVRNELREEEDRRNELFAGAQQEEGAENQISPVEEADEELTVEQLVNQAQRTHKDTTAVAQRALRVVEQTKQVQAATLQQLDKQNRKVDMMNYNLHQMNTDLSYSERILSYMRRCCCFFVCDSCTGADPELAMRDDWEKKVKAGKTSAVDKRNESKASRAASERAERRAAEKAAAKAARGIFGTGVPMPAAFGPPPPPRTNSEGGVLESGEAGPSQPKRALGFQDPDIKLPEEFASKETAMHVETRKQNELLDQIHDGLGGLMEGAKRVGDELEDQSKGLQQLKGRTEDTKGRIKDMNTKSTLRNFKVKLGVDKPS